MTEETEIADVVGRLDELTDLFRRRLLEDRQRQKVVETLSLELAEARSLLVGQLERPFVLRVLSVIDRLDRADDDFAESIAQELIEALRLHGYEDVAPGTGPFDPALHEALGTELVDAQDVGLVISVLGRGMRRGDRIVRPAQVIVGVGPSDVQSAMDR